MLNILAVPAFKDNYIWVIHDGSRAAVVDPGDADPVLDALHRLGLNLAAILLTHHHPDHVGGVAGLQHHFPVPVYGPRNEAIRAITHRAGEGDTVSLTAPSLELNVLDVPGHTAGHIAYYSAAHGWLFCGDTLFAGGCGRLFEGTPAQMAVSLGKLASLPDATAVYCAHEYTLSNLRFAIEVDPHNTELAKRLHDAQATRDAGLATIPSTIGLEKATNPFLRYDDPAVVKHLISTGHVSSGEPIAVFTAIRRWKDSYR